MSTSIAGRYETYMARDGHEFRAWVAAPIGKPRGTLVVLQEIFGLNAHIRSVADGYANEGYLCVAPALFDRVERKLELGYTAEQAGRGRGTMLQIKPEESHADISACIAVLRHSGRVGLLGYCWGGYLAFCEGAASTVDALVAYYPVRIGTRLDRPPRCPALLHFGARDTHLPLADVERVRSACPQAEICVYEAEHGFNCEQRPSYDAASAALARTRTLAFLDRHLREP